MKLTLKEMQGLLNGKCLPSDLIVGETLAEYLVRKFDELEQKLADSQREFTASDSTADNLKMQLEKLAAENAGLKAANDVALKILNDEETMVTSLWASSIQEIEVKTPATDAYLAEVRAQGADECVRQLVISDDNDFSDAPNICAMVAHQLRKGVQS